MKDIIKQQHDVLVQAIQTIDDEFYMRRMSPEMQALRDALDKILNHNESKWSKKNNRRPDVYVQDARAIIQHASIQVPDWR